MARSINKCVEGAALAVLYKCRSARFQRKRKEGSCSLAFVPAPFVPRPCPSSSFNIREFNLWRHTSRAGETALLLMYTALSIAPLTLERASTSGRHQGITQKWLSDARKRLATLSVAMLPRRLRDEQSADASQLQDISDVCAIFEEAFAAGGGAATLALVDRYAFADQTRAALIASGRAAEIEIDEHVMAGLGVSYHEAGEPQRDIFGVNMSVGKRLYGTWHDMKRYNWIQGSLWWLRHWLGAFLGDKVLQRAVFSDVGAAMSEVQLFAWLQRDMQGCQARLRNCRHDFSRVAALHGAIFHIMAHHARPGYPHVDYPTSLAKEWCPDRTPLLYECRHGIGHGVLYATWLRRPELTDYSACKQPRGYNLAPPTRSELLLVAAACRQADAIPTNVTNVVPCNGDECTFGGGCRSGEQHSRFLFDRRMRRYG